MPPALPPGPGTSRRTPSNPLRLISQNLLAVALLLGTGAWFGESTSAQAAPPASASPASIKASAPAAPPAELLASPLADIPPSVSLNLPAQAFLGEDVSFTVSFDNTDTVPGYGPILDLILPTNGADGDQNTDPPLDGLSFVSATYLSVAVESTVQTFPGSGAVTCVDHPYIVDDTGAPVQVCGDAGDTYVALRLPFGSFTPDQPPLDMAVTLSMSNLADLGAALTVQARGGYQFGFTPENDYCCGDDPSDSLSSFVNDSVTPTLFTVDKSYNGPEDETATGPNFPRRYTVSAEIAPGQALSPFNLTDVLPTNMQFSSLVSTSPGGASCSLPSTLTPGGTLSCDFASASGTASMTFEYFIPRLDSGSAAVIDPVSGDDASSCDQAQGGGTWSPLDPRDTGGVFTQNPGGCEHTLADKSIAIQKGVSVVGGGQPVPDRTLEYTLSIQISDFFAFDGVVVTDDFSDGQHFDPTFAPTLTVAGNGYSLGSAAFASANFDVTCNYTGGPGPECTADNPGANDGSTTLTFRLSDEVITRGQNGRLVGGCINPITGSNPPNCSAYNDGPTTAIIVFRTVIQDQFTDTFPSGDASVDQGDTLDDDVTASGNVLNTLSFAAQGTEADGSGAGVLIGRGSLTKSVYAINGSTSFSTPVEVKPGDTVTFRLRYSMPTGDVEDLLFDDYLPLPVFHVGDPDEDGSAGPAWTFVPTVSAAAPAAGVAKFGPADTFFAYSAITPSPSANVGNNRLEFSYGDFDGPTEQTYTIDLLFTVTVSDDPFADRLFLTNQAHAFEGSTNAGPSSADSIVQIVLTEPVLATTKSVVASDNTSPGVTFTPALPITFDPPGTTPGPRWSGNINSSFLASTPIDSDISGVDANDLVTFAIFVENSGTSINGAFDLVLQDVFDAAAFEFPAPGDPASLNLQIFYGNGSGPIAFTQPDDSPATADDLFGGGIKLVDPVGEGVCSEHDPNLGNNVIVITYDLRLQADLAPGTYTNTGSLVNYSGSEGGPNFLPEPDSDDADVTTDTPDTAKTRLATEISIPTNTTAEAVIGELITYRVTLTLPEGSTPAAQLVDTLDTGLAFVDCLSVTRSSADLTTSFGAGDFSDVCSMGTNPVISAVGGSAGRRATWDLGTISNANTDNATAETLIIDYRVVVLNITGNQNGTNRNNAAVFGWTGGSASASAANTRIIEPRVTTSKSVLPTSADAGDTVTFTITQTNPNAADDTTAYDGTLSDSVPAGLTYVSGSLALGACAAVGASVSEVAAPTLTASWTSLAANASCSVTFQATVDYTVIPGQQIVNTAETRWTSLPGAVTDRSSFNSSSDERTGAGGLMGGGALDDYRTQGQATLSIAVTQHQKYLFATSEAHTGLAGGTERVAVGEIARYRLVVVLPEGTSPNFQVRDSLPAGLTFLNDGTAKAAFVSSDGIGSADVGTLPVPGITDPDCQLVGSAADGTSPSIPAACAPLADNNVGSTNQTDTDVDTFNTGDDVFLKLGGLTNVDSDGDPEFVVLEFNALVDNTVAGSNDAGDSLTDNFLVFINGTQIGNASNDIIVGVAEPLLTLAKAAAIDPSADAGDAVTYTLTITAASANTRSTAFELNLTDTLDANLNPGTVGLATTQPATCTGNGSGTTAFGTTSGFVGQVLTVTATCLDPGRSITVTVNATVAATAPAGYTIPNTGTVTYTSLPGAGTSPNPTGSVTPGGSGATNGERDGSGVAPNDYTSSSSAPLDLSTPAMEKLDPVPTAYAVGEQISFTLRITLPEGVTQAMQVVDNLPSGLTYVSHQVITTAAGSGGLLVDDFNGALPAPTVTAPGGSGDDLTLDFGDTTTADDNDPDTDAFLVRVVAVVLNEAGNQDGVSRTNTGQLNYTRDGSPAAETDSTTISIIEPVLTVDKVISVLPSPADAGGTVSYSVTLQHDPASTAPAYDVAYSDALPAELDLDLASVNVALAGGAAGATDSSAGDTVNVSIDSIPLGGSVTITYEADLNTTVTPGQTIANTGDLTWTSTPGSNPDERTGAGGLDDYADSDSTSFDIADPVFGKSLESTSATHTAGTDLAIGEVATFGLYVTLPEGSTPSLQIIDDLPLGLEYVPGSAQVITETNPPAPCGTLAADFNGTLPAPSITAPGGSGGDVTFDFGAITVAADDDPGNNTFLICFEALAVNEAGNQNGDTLTNSASMQVDAGPLVTDSLDTNVVEPELTITKAVDDDTPGVGQTFTYTLTVEHLPGSTAEAFDLTVSDPLPANVNRVGGPSVTSAPGACAGTVTDNSAVNTISLSVASLPLGCTLTVDYDAQIASPTAVPGDTFDNTASLDWTSLPGTDASERTGGGGVDDYADDATQTVTFTAVELAITKDDAGVTVQPGDTLSYTLDYENTGNSLASGVVISETVPDNTTFNDGASTAGWSCADGSPAGTVCQLTIGDVGIGASGSATFAVTVDDPVPSGVTQIDNSASIADDGAHGSESDLTNNSDDETTPLDAAPDLAITKNDGVTIVSPGATLTYTLTVENIGDQDATGVEVTDTIPANTAFVSASAGGTESGGVVSWPAFDLDAGDTTTFTVTVDVDDPFPVGVSTIVNTAHVEDDGSNGPDPTPGDNDASDTDNVVTSPNSDLNKSVFDTNQAFTADPSVAIGEIVTYEIVFTVPPGTMTSLTLTDVLERGLVFLDCQSITPSIADITTTVAGGFADVCANPAVSTEPPGSPNPADPGRRVVFDFGDVSNSGAAAGTVTVLSRVVVLDSLENQDGVSLNNAAELEWSSGTLTASATDVAIVEPDMELAKTADRTTAPPGAAVTFTLTLGQTDLSNVNAYDVVLTDTLPVGLDYVPGSLTIVSGPPGGVTDDSAAPALTVTWASFPLFTGPDRTAATVQFQATVGDLDPGQSVVNTAFLEWSTLPGDVSAPQSTFNDLSTERRYDPASPADVYQVSAEITIRAPQLPATGFAPGRITALPSQPVDRAYADLGGLWLQIPRLGVGLPIVGIPLAQDGWDLTWLSNQAGWLEGTAYPTWAGNTALTAHAVTPDGLPGPFARLAELRWGDQVIVQAFGREYVYEVRQVRTVRPNDRSVLRHEELDWLTLLTCALYDEASDSYRTRVAVRAVLIEVR
jgi:LPXTG-site transpeptidase (sortase) family protein